MDPEGRDVLLVVAKAAFRWNPDGSLQPLAPVPAVAVADVFAGPPATTGLLVAGELTLPKPRVDILIQGEIVLATPTEQVDCALDIGQRLVKAVRVFGDRHWRHGAAGSMVPSRPRPFVRMPIEWQRSFGGADPGDASFLDRRNPIGRGVRRQVAALEGHPAPNFEDPAAPISSLASTEDAKQLHAPVGWGAIAPHWQSRSELAGTYDARWQAERFPLLPLDFNPGFLNAAPRDQQLERYQPGVEVRLTGFTPRRRETFVLPELAPPLTVVDARTIIEVPTRVDTVIIEPMEQRLSLVARAVYPLKNVEALAIAFLGPLAAEQRQALRAGRPVPLAPPARA